VNVQIKYAICANALNRHVRIEKQSSLYIYGDKILKNDVQHDTNNSKSRPGFIRICCYFCLV
jgi:hypothetical protein